MYGNSDNVVRAGLTNKFKDVDTLLNMLTYDDKNIDILSCGFGTEKVYNSEVE